MNAVNLCLTPDKNDLINDILHTRSLHMIIVLYFTKSIVTEAAPTAAVVIWKQMKIRMSFHVCISKSIFYTFHYLFRASLSTVLEFDIFLGHNFLVIYLLTFINAPYLSFGSKSITRFLNSSKSSTQLDTTRLIFLTHWPRWRFPHPLLFKRLF